VGITHPSSELSLELPGGSYLFVFRKEGYVDVRYPVAIPTPGGGRTQIHLLGKEELPPGNFIYVPAGRFTAGRDREAFQPLKAEEANVDRGFFIGRYEVTVGEYLKFVNDPEVFARTDEDGTAAPEAEAVKERLGKNRRFPGRVRLIPKLRLGSSNQETVVWTRKDGRWNRGKTEREDLPMYGIPQFAAVEYAHWRSKKEGWRYRLPTDGEWERAARGADARIHVWGDYLVWSFCCCPNGTYRTPLYLQRVGISPMDESVFGVCDMAGSVQEFTSDRPNDRYSYNSVRGGGIDTTDAFYFRIATRNGLLPTGTKRGTGFRLAADVGQPAGEPRPIR
jgi:formylglycine-generating enzyme required for sulfatase activity